MCEQFSFWLFLLYGKSFLHQWKTNDFLFDLSRL